MARFSGAAVLLILLVTVSMYTCAFLGGTVIGRTLERKSDRVGVSVSIRGVVQYLTKELWDTKGRGRDAGDEAVRMGTEEARVVMANHCLGRSLRPNLRHWTSRDDQGAAVQGVAVLPRPRHSNYSREITHALPRRVIKVGPWGGSGGQPFYMRGSSVPRLRTITLYHSSSAIHSLSCDYQDDDGQRRTAGPWGLPHSFGSTAVRATINLSEDELLAAIEGTRGHFGRVPDLVITSLTFRTSSGRTYGPYGGEKRGRRTDFSIPAENGCIVGFWGRSGWLLDAIGVYIRACTPTPPAYKPLY